MNQLVSIIMPAYNVEKFIGRAIDSVLSQTYTNFELLISDDPSTDNTRKIIQKYTDERIKKFHNIENVGYLQTCNNLFAKAQGDFITFQDADDYSDNRRIELLIKEFENDTELGLCGSNFIRIDENDLILEHSNFALTKEEIIKKIPEKYEIVPSTLMIKKEVYEKIGGYNIFFDKMAQEDIYWSYLGMSSFKLKNIQDHLYYYRFNPNSISGNISNNPSKLHSPKIVQLLIKQRQETGTDLLEQGKEEELLKILNEMNKPFIDNPSYYFNYISKRRFYEGKKKLAIKYMINAIKINPLKLEYYKDLFYFLRKKV